MSLAPDVKVVVVPPPAYTTSTLVTVGYADDVWKSDKAVLAPS